MGEIKVDPEFKALIPGLTAEEFAQLEENVKRDGCRDQLVTWNGILLDGHNRLKICTEHNLHYNTHEIDLPDRGAAEVWIIDNQFGRRNITLYQRAVLALKRKEIVERRAKERQRASGGAVVQKSAQPGIKTREELGRLAGTSHYTIKNVEAIEANGIQPIREMVQSGAISIDRGAQLSRLSPEEQQKIVDGGADAVKQAAKNIPKKGTQSKHVYEATEAMQIATMAICQLERIRDDDPRRIEAFERVIAWINKHK